MIVIYRDDKAVLGMPVYLTVAIIVSAAIIALFATSTYYIIKESQTHQVRN